jgi:hypothetical protein
VAKFNELRGKPELKVDVTKADSPHPEMFFDGFIVSRLDKSKQSLRVNYSALTGVLSYEYGGGKGNFTLKASEDGTMQFQTTYSEVKTIEEIGTELLSKFSESTL